MKTRPDCISKAAHDKISKLLQSVVMEQNDGETQRKIKDGVTEILSKENIYSFLVICDESNNPPSTVDLNRVNVQLHILKQNDQKLRFVEYQMGPTETMAAYTDPMDIAASRIRDQIDSDVLSKVLDDEDLVQPIE